MTVSTEAIRDAFYASGVEPPPGLVEHVARMLASHWPAPGLSATLILWLDDQLVPGLEDDPGTTRADVAESLAESIRTFARS